MRRPEDWSRRRRIANASVDGLCKGKRVVAFRFPLPLHSYRLAQHGIRRDGNSVRIGLAVAEYFVEGIAHAAEILSRMDNRWLPSELAQRDSSVVWISQREGDNMRARMKHDRNQEPCSL